VQYGFCVVSAPSINACFCVRGESQRTPASTLVISRTLIPANGPFPFVVEAAAAEANRLRRPGRGGGVGGAVKTFGLDLSIGDVRKGLFHDDADMLDSDSLQTETIEVHKNDECWNSYK
jgi:hypothetical protein